MISFNSFILLVFIIWLFNLELNPSLGNIWLRPNEFGDYTFVPINILNLLIKPFQLISRGFTGAQSPATETLWSFHFWDLNFYIFLSLSLLIFFIFKHFF
jgi:hypothetical protein